MPKASSAFLWMAALLLFLLAAAPVQVVNAQNCGTSRRRPWRSLSCSDQDEYLDAYRQLKASGRWNELVRVHQQSGDWGHEVPMFLLWHRYVIIIIKRQKKEKYFGYLFSGLTTSWVFLHLIYLIFCRPNHRWYVWIFERELQRISGTCLTIPYWDWERPSSFETVLHPETFGTNNGGGCVTDGIARDWTTAENGRCPVRAFDNRERVSVRFGYLWLPFSFDRAFTGK